MKNIKWLLNLADGKPLIFSLALLLIAVSAMSIVIVNRDNRIQNCEKERLFIERQYIKKIDSINLTNEIKELALNEEIKSTLSSIIEDYKIQLKEQKNLQNQIKTTINKNKKIIKENRLK